MISNSMLHSPFSLIISSIFLLMFLFSLRVNKQILSPPAMITLVWGVALFISSFLFSAVGAIGEYGVIVIFIGVTCFYITSLFTSIPIKGREYRWDLNEKKLKYTVLILLILEAILTPLYYDLLFSITNTSDFLTLLLYMRKEELSGGLKIPYIFTQLDYLAIISFVLSYSLLKIKNSNYNKIILLLSIILGGAIVISTGARAPIIRFLFIVMFFTLYFSKGKNGLKYLTYGILFFCIFAVITVARGSKGTNVDEGFFHNLIAVFNAISFYAFTGIFSFSEYVNDPKVLIPSWDVLKVIYMLFSFVDSSIIVPPTHAAAMVIFDGDYSNTHTIFFAMYPIYGIAGVVFFMSLYGYICGKVYNMISAGRLRYIALYSCILSSIPLTIFNDSFFQIAIFYIKIFIIFYFFDFVCKNDKKYS